jgi:anti-sigma factor RsiW
MTDLRGRTFSDLVAGLNAGQHLAVDAVVAFVDGELKASARDRAAEHLTTCQACAAEVAEQRQARSAVRSAQVPRVPAGLLAALCDIPHTADLPSAPDGLSVTAQGTVVAFADPSSAPSAPLGATPPLGASARWGTGPAVLGRRIGRSGAGAVVSGLMLGVLVMTVLENPLVPGTGLDPETPAPTSTEPAMTPAAPTVEPVAAPVVAPAAVPVPQPAVLPDHAALWRMTTSPGWYGLRIPR